MSVARKRAKVKKKTQAARGSKKKRATKKTARTAKAKAKKKRGKKTRSSKVVKKTTRRPVSVNTKRSKRVRTPPRRPKKKPLPRKKKAKKRKKRAPIAATPLLQQIAAAFEVPERIVTLTAFLTQPQVADQIRDRIIDKGLAELRRGLVQTDESIILGHLIIAEQLGNFDQRARELAVEFRRPLRDIYELWKSPKLDETAE